MMKKIARVTATLLLLSLLLCSFAACRNQEEEYVPEGMMIANVKDDDFRLFVPTNWNLNTAYGTAGAYYHLDNLSTVSVVKYPVTEEVQASIPEGGDAQKITQRIDSYRTLYLLPAIEAISTGEVATYSEETSDTLLDTVAARRYHMLASVDGKNVHFVQVVGENNSAFYVFTFACLTELYDQLISYVEQMLDNFIFADPYLPDEFAREEGEGEAPAGMFLVSNDDVAYRFYAPKTWVADYEQEIFAAFFTADRSSVSVLPYVPVSVSMSVADYFEMNKRAMIRVGGENSFTFLKEEKVTLGGRDATAYTYTYRVGNTVYQYKQVVAAYKGSIYNLTYTALPQNFDAHLADVDAMIAAFAFH